MDLALADLGVRRNMSIRPKFLQFHEVSGEKKIAQIVGWRLLRDWYPLKSWIRHCPGYIVKQEGQVYCTVPDKLLLKYFKSLAHSQLSLS